MTSVAAADDRLELLRSVTNVDGPTAERLLQRAKGDVAAAANLFFESGDLEARLRHRPPRRSPPPARRGGRLLGDLVVRAYTTVKLAAAEPRSRATPSSSTLGGGAARSRRRAERKAATSRRRCARRPGGGAELGRLLRDVARYLRLLLRDGGSRSPRRSRARSPASI